MNVMRLGGMTAVALLLVTGCDAPIQTGYDFDSSADFGSYATYAWEEAEPLPTGDPRLDGNPIFQDRVRTSVSSALAGHGLRQVESSPDLLVHTHVSVRDRVEVHEADRSAGYDVSSDYGPGTQVYQYEEGTLVVDLVDAEAMRVIWRGWIRTDVSRALSDPVALERLVDAAVEQLFRSYPPAGARG